MSAAVDAALRWMRSVQVDTAIADKRVPGASSPERRHLAALGAIARLMLGDEPAGHLPTEIIEWLAAAPQLPPELAADLTPTVRSTADERVARPGPQPAGAL